MSPKRSPGGPEPDEETPLLHDGNTPRKDTPLPITQIAVLLLLQLTEPLTSLAIRPYINQVRPWIPNTYIIIVGDVRFSSSVSFQSLVATKEKSDTMQD